MRAAAVQLNSTADVDANLEAADRHVRAAARDGARLVVLPEKWSVLGTPAGLRSGGRSMIVDPWGVVLATAPDRVGHVVADLDLGAQDRIRRERPCLALRRGMLT